MFDKLAPSYDLLKTHTHSFYLTRVGDGRLLPGWNLFVLRKWWNVLTGTGDFAYSGFTRDYYLKTQTDWHGYFEGWMKIW